MDLTKCVCAHLCVVCVRIYVVCVCVCVLALGGGGSFELCSDRVQVVMKYPLVVTKQRSKYGNCYIG